MYKFHVDESKQEEHTRAVGQKRMYVGFCYYPLGVCVCVCVLCTYFIFL